MSLESLRGRAVALTFLDPVCTSDCPIIATELRETDTVLGAEARHVYLVAICANPQFIAPEYLTAFDQMCIRDRSGAAREFRRIRCGGANPYRQTRW